MIIPSQLPQYVAATRSGALQALALQSGQIVSGQVVGPAPNGGTQVQISGQLLNLVLPQAAKAGDTLRFEVQGSGAQIRLALQASVSKPALPVSPNGAPASAYVSPQSSASSLPTPAQTSAPAIPAAAAGAGQSQSPAAIAAAPSGAAPPPQPGAAAPGVTTSTANIVRAAPPETARPANVAPATVAAGTAPATSGTTAAPPATGPVATSAPLTPGSAATPPGSATAGQAVPGVVSRPVAPYATAPAATAAPAPSATASAAAQTTSASAAVGPAPTAAVARGGAPISAPAITPVFASTPEAALSQMVQTALPQQNSIANLMTALSSIVGKVALPEPVARAAQQVLNNRVAIDGGKLDGAALQKAMLGSGVFQEAALAREGTPLLPPQADTKAALLALRQSLSSWLGQQPQLLASISQLAPPLRGRIARVPMLDIAPIDPAGAAEETGKHLLDRTEAALARTRLHQHASLPDPHVKGAEWSADLPVVVGGQQSVLQLQIHRDQHNDNEQTTERGWQMRFAINLPGMGEVGAQVSLRGTSTGIMLWAADPATTDALSADIDGLRDALSAAGMTPGAVIVRQGPPPEVPQPASSGHLVDSRR